MSTHHDSARIEKAIALWCRACSLRSKAHHSTTKAERDAANMKRNAIAAEAVNTAPELFQFKEDPRTPEYKLVLFTSPNYTLGPSFKGMHVLRVMLVRPSRREYVPSPTTRR